MPLANRACCEIGRVTPVVAVGVNDRLKVPFARVSQQDDVSSARQTVAREMAVVVVPTVPETVPWSVAAPGRPLRHSRVSANAVRVFRSLPRNPAGFISGPLMRLRSRTNWRDGRLSCTENYNLKHPSTERVRQRAPYCSEVTEYVGMNPAVADAIAQAIRKAGFASHEEFAHVIGLPKSTLSRILSGKADPKLSTLQRIADGLEMSLSRLLRGSEGKAAPRRGRGRPSSQAITLTISVPPGTQAEDWFRLAAEECAALAGK